MTLNEQYLAGCILLEHSVIWGLDGIVTAEDFEDSLCKAIFVAANEIKDEGGVVDPSSIRDRARRDGTELPYDYLKQLLEITPTYEYFAEYGRRVAEDARTRRIKEWAQEIQNDNTSSPDELLDKMQQLAAEQERQRTSKPLYQSISARDLQRKDLPPVKFLIEGMFPEGTGLLSAASKIGKSWMVLDMGLCIAAGKPFMGHKTNQCDVLYLALEDSLNRLQDRMNNILQGDPAPEQFRFITEAPKLDNGLLDMLDGHFKKFPNTGLVIIDTLQKIRGQALPRESAYAQDYREMETLKAFFDKRGISVEFVHHNRKMGDDNDPFNMISGTNGIMGAADTIWTITKKRADQEATLHITGRDVPQSDTIIRFDKDVWKWKAVGSADWINEQRARLEYENNPVVKTVRELLKHSKDGEWSGTAGELMDEGRRITKMRLAATPQEMGQTLKKLSALFQQYDAITHKTPSNGSGGKKHYFYDQSWTDKAEGQEQEMLPL